MSMLEHQPRQPVLQQAGTGTLPTKLVRLLGHNQAARQQAGIGILSLKNAKIAAVPVVR
jgi:hypothetical protein